MFRSPILPQHRFARSLAVSWKEGIPASVMIGVTDYYLIPLGLLLGATPQEVGWIVAIPHLAGSAAQLLSVHLLKLSKSRLSFLVGATALQAVCLFPMALLPLADLSKKIWVFIGLVLIFRVTGNLIATLWGSLMSDYLAPEERGSYLGWRARISGLSALAGLCGGGLLLFFLKKVSPEWSFAALFAGIAVARLVSAVLMARMEDLPIRTDRGADFTFLQFVKRYRQSNFVKFVLYVAAIVFAANLSAPFFSVYMLNHLGVDYLTFMWVQLCAALTSLLSFPIWGYHADRYGNARVLRFTGRLIPIIPFLWVAFGTFPYILIIELFAGFVWGGFNLCSVNFIFDAVSPEKRIRCLSYVGFINGMAIFLGASAGGWLATHLPPIHGTALVSVFAVSGILRFLSYFLLSKKFKEVRATQEVSSQALFFSVIGLKPLPDRTTES